MPAFLATRCTPCCPSFKRAGVWLACFAVLLSTLAATSPPAAAEASVARVASSPGAPLLASEPGQAIPEQTEPLFSAQQQSDQARRTGTRVEVPHLRTATSNTYVLPTGPLLTEVTMRPVNYQDESGSWQPVDGRLVPTSAGWRAAAVGFVAELPASLADGPVKVAKGDTWIEMRLDGAADTAGVVTENSITYPSVFPGVDVKFSASGAGLRKVISLADRSARGDFSFDVTTSADTTLTAHASGVAVTRPNSPSLVIPLPWAVDQSDDLSAGAGSPNARLTSARTARGHKIGVGLDRAWLASPKRAFPVLLDPTVFTEDAYLRDCFVYEGAVTNRYCDEDQLQIGGDAGLRRRSLVKFAIPIPREATVIDSRLTGHTQTALYGTNTGTVTLHRVTSEWDEESTAFSGAKRFGSVSWNCRDQLDGCNPWTPGGEFDAGASSTAQVSAAAGSRPEWRGLGPLVQEWVSQSAPNHGLLMKVAAEPTTTVYKLSSADNIAAPGPQIAITWAPRIGEQSFETFYRDRLTDRSDVAINVANGNLIVHARDVSVAGTGQNFTVERTYNSQAAMSGISGPVPANGSLGPGWTSGTLLDTALNVISGDRAEFHGPDGRLISFAWNGSAWVAPPAANATLAYDSLATQYVMTMHESNLRYFFSAAGNNAWMLSRVVDRNNNTIRHDFTGGDGRTGAAGSVVDTQNRRFGLSYLTADNGGKRLAGVTDPTGRSQRYNYTNGLLTSVDNGVNSGLLQSATTRYKYNSAGLLSEITDPSGRVTRINYAGSYVTTVSRITDPASCCTGYITRFREAFRGVVPRTTAITDANGRKTTYNLDDRFRVLGVQDALGRTRSRTLTPNGSVESSTGAATGTITFGYEANNRESMTSRSISTGAKDTAEYKNPPDSAGAQYQPSATVNPRQFAMANGSSTQLSYDAAGNRAQSMIATEGSKTAHNANGTVKSVTTPNNAGTTSGRLECASSDTALTGASTSSDNCSTVTYQYRANGELLSATTTPPIGAKWLRAATSNFDALGRVSSTDDGRGIITSYRYDGLDRPTRVSYSDGTPTVDLTYDGAGNVRQVLTSGLGTTVVDYDQVNRPVQRYVPNRGTLKYTYDAVGNMTSSTQPALVVAGQEIAALPTTYSYDGVNNLISLAEPGGSCTSDPLVLCTTFGYDLDDRRIRTTYPGTVGVVQSVSYDKAGRLRTVKTGKPGAPLMVSLEYCYARQASGTTNTASSGCSTATGDDMNILTWRRDNTTGKKTKFTYDEADRLESADDLSTRYFYDYDANGNRIVETVSGSTTEKYSYEHDVADALCSRRSGTTTGANCTDVSNTSTTTIYRHDAAGNMTANGAITAAYNGASQTTRYGVPTFSYAGVGQSDRLSAGDTTFTNGLLGAQRETSGEGLSTDFVKTTDGQLVSMTLPDGSKHYYLFDGQGSVVGLVGADGSRTATYTYDPFGGHHTATASAISSAAESNPYRFISGYLDPTGLYKLGVRYYNPTLGRFTQLDPTGQDAHYIYARNNPVNYSDPSGGGAKSFLLKELLEQVASIIRRSSDEFVDLADDFLDARAASTLRNSSNKVADAIEDVAKIPDVARRQVVEGIYNRLVQSGVSSGTAEVIATAVDGALFLVL